MNINLWMKHLILFFTLQFISFGTLAKYSVIVNPSNSASVTESDAKKLFLAKSKKFSNGETAIPINQTAESPIRSAFNQNVIGKSDSQVKSYWSAMIFSGKAVPLTEVDNDAEVIKLVGTNPNAIGYVDSAQVNGSVKVIFSFD